MSVPYVYNQQQYEYHPVCGEYITSGEPVSC